MAKCKLVNFYKEETNEYFNIVHKDRVLVVLPIESENKKNPNIILENEEEVREFIKKFTEEKIALGFSLNGEYDFVFDFTYGGQYEKLDGENYEQDENLSFIYDDDEYIGEINYSLFQIKECEDSHILERVFRKVGGEFIDQCYIAFHRFLSYLQIKDDLYANINFVIDVERGVINFFKNDDFASDMHPYFTHHIYEVLIKFDILCRKLNKSRVEEAGRRFEIAIQSLDEDDMIERIAEDIMKIRGSYNYIGEIEGIFYKNERAEDGKRFHLKV